MSELPERPDLDQLRHQARELLRAATRGQPSAVARLRAVSGGVTLSAAQLAVAREYGYRSWPALKADVERRRLSPFPAGDEPVAGPPAERWSLGGTAAIKTSVGTLLPEALVADAGQAVLYASLTPSGASSPGRRQAALEAPPRITLARWAWRRQVQRARRKSVVASANLIRTLARPDELTVVDDRGTNYALRPQGGSGRIGPSGEPVGPRALRFWLDPVPLQGTGWLELRRQDGTATRLLPSARPASRVGPLAPVALSRAERELTDQALALIELRLAPGDDLAGETLRQRCSAALARTEEIQRSGALGARELPEQLRRLCAELTGHHPDGRIPAGWSGMLAAARQTDGPRHHLDIGAALPPIDGVIVRADCLISGPDSWRLYLRATPSWWHRDKGDRCQGPVSVYAHDDRGGMYLSTLKGGTRHPVLEEPIHEERVSHEVLALRFLPRLDPRARALTLTFRGAEEEVAVQLSLSPPAP